VSENMARYLLKPYLLWFFRAPTVPAPLGGLSVRTQLFKYELSESFALCRVTAGLQRVNSPRTPLAEVSSKIYSPLRLTN
jgi:hypothetical protein